jgi:hypothetical protein
MPSHFDAAPILAAALSAFITPEPGMSLVKLIFYSWRRVAPCKLMILFVWMGVVCKSVVPRQV